MKTLETATTLVAETMIAIGEGVGLQVTVVLSNMDQPLGRAVGNALEVKEAIATLQGEPIPDFDAHCEAVAAEMLLLGRKAADEETARHMAREAIADGRAWQKFRTLVQAQGGDVALVDHPERLPQARHVEELLSPQEGYIAAVDAMTVGLTAVALGAGRMRQGDPIDHAVGLVLAKKVGDFVRRGESLLTLHSNEVDAKAADKLAAAKEQVLAAYVWSAERVSPPPLIYEVMRASSR